MKAVILAYCKQRQISMVYYFGLVVSEKANGKGSAYGEYGQFGYKVDARRASGAVALRHQQLPGANFGSDAAEVVPQQLLVFVASCSVAFFMS